MFKAAWKIIAIRYADETKKIIEYKQYNFPSAWAWDWCLSRNQLDPKRPLFGYYSTFEKSHKRPFAFRVINSRFAVYSTLDQNFLSKIEHVIDTHQA